MDHGVLVSPRILLFVSTVFTLVTVMAGGNIILPRVIVNFVTQVVSNKQWLKSRVAMKKPYLRLANKNKRLKMGKRTQTLDRGTLPRRSASRSRLFTVYVETLVLRQLF